MRGTKARKIRQAVEFSPSAERPKTRTLMKTSVITVPAPELGLDAQGNLKTRPVTYSHFMVINQIGGKRRLYQFIKKSI